MLKMYKTKGGRVIHLAVDEVKELREKHGQDSYIEATETDLNQYLINIGAIIPEDSIKVFYPSWDKFLMHDGYGYIDYQYRTYGPKEGLFLETEIKKYHQLALVHHSPLKVNEIAQYWKKPIVAYTMWEADVMPARMFDALMKHTIALIVPSIFCRNVLIKQGYARPIYVCNQGVDTKHYYYVEREEPNVFRFLHNATGNGRKGWEYVIEAFKQEFENHDKVRLTMKGIIPQRTISGHVTPQFVPFWNTKNVDWDDTVLDKKETLKLYQEHHCLVFPTKGEGWGLVPHEAIMTGLPTITTKGHSIDDYWSRGMVEVKTTKQPSKYVATPLIEGMPQNPESWKNSGQWYETDIQDLRIKMREVYNNWQFYKKEAKKGSKYLTKNFDSLSMVKRLKKILTHINDTLI